MRSDEEKAITEFGNSEERWSVDELNDPLPARSLMVDRIAGLSESQTHSAALICAALLAVFAISGLALKALDQGEQPLALSDCAHERDGAERLRCFDQLANSLARPFKGGSPFMSISNPEL